MYHLQVPSAFPLLFALFLNLRPYICELFQCFRDPTICSFAAHNTVKSIIAAYSERPDTVLTGIVGEAAATILQVVFCIFLLVQGVCDGFVHPAALGGFLPFQPVPERFQDLRGFLVPVFMSLLVGVPVARQIL